jgi:hypothetical protein
MQHIQPWVALTLHTRRVAGCCGRSGFAGMHLLWCLPLRVVVTYGDLRRSPGWDGFRVDFGSVKEIVFRGLVSPAGPGGGN